MLGLAGIEGDDIEMSDVLLGGKVAEIVFRKSIENFPGENVKIGDYDISC